MKAKKNIFIVALITIATALTTTFFISCRSGHVNSEYVRVYCFSGYPPIRAYQSGLSGEASCYHGHRLSMESLVVFDTDIVEEYKDTLYAMFGEEWTVLSVEERYRAPADLCHLIRGPLHRYTKWTIEYQDGNGETRAFEVNNHSPFYFHVTRHIMDKIALYYREHFVDEYLAMLLAEFPVNYFYRPFRVEFVRRTDYWSPSSHIWDSCPPWADEAEEYRRNLATPEGAIPLYRLTPSNVFEFFPLYLSFHLRITDEQYVDDLVLLENLYEAIELLIISLKTFTDGHVNVRVILNDSVGINIFRWTYVHGEQVFSEANYRGHSDWGEFARIVFERFLARNEEVHDITNYGLPITFTGEMAADFVDEEYLENHPDAPRFVRDTTRGVWMMFYFGEAVNDVVFVRAGPAYFTEEHRPLYKVFEELAVIGDLEANQPFFLWTYGIFGTWPSQAIGFTYVDGVRYYIPFIESMEDGSLMLITRSGFTFDE